jgi:hypothetical protein
MTENGQSMAPEITESEVTIIAIAGDDTWLHLYSDVRSLLGDTGVGANGGSHGSIEFFDGEGRRLAPVFGPDWKLEDLQRSAEVLDPCHLRRRLYAVVRHVEGHLRRHPEILEPFRLTLEEAVAKLPRLPGPGLDDDLAVLWESLGRVGHSAGFFHNALHAGGWTHN